MLTFTSFSTPPEGNGKCASETSLYATSGQDSSIRKLINGTWTVIGNPTGYNNPTSLAVTSDGQTIVVSKGEVGANKISTDGGNSWTVIAGGTGVGYLNSGAVGNKFYFTLETFDPYVLTTAVYDGSWHTITPSNIYISNVCGSAGNYLATKNDGTVWSSTDGLAWSQLSAQPTLGMGGMLSGITFSAGKFYIVIQGMMGNEIQSYSNGSWTQETTSGLDVISQPLGILANAASSPAMEWYLYVPDMMGTMYQAVSYSIPATIAGDVTIEPVGGVINLAAPVEVTGTSSLTLNVPSLDEIQGTGHILVAAGGHLKVGNGQEIAVTDGTRYELAP